MDKDENCHWKSHKTDAELLKDNKRHHKKAKEFFSNG